MVNTAPLIALGHNFMALVGLSGGAIWASLVGLPIRKRIIRRWARR